MNLVRANKENRSELSQKDWPEDSIAQLRQEAKNMAAGMMKCEETARDTHTGTIDLKVMNTHTAKIIEESLVGFNA